MRLFSSNRNYSAEVNQCLQGVRDPVTEKSLPSSGRIDSLVVTENGDVTLALTATPQTVEADERREYILRRETPAKGCASGSKRNTASAGH